MNRVFRAATVAAPAMLAAAGSCAAQSGWAPGPLRLETKWTRQVSPTNALPEYPRPQMVRRDWLNLNGLWDFSITPTDAPMPKRFAQRILVPFPVESALCGVAARITGKERVWYRRTLDLPAKFAGKRTLLHFGAVDWDTEVFVNGKSVGMHRGGYDPFSIDITDSLKPGQTQEIVVAVRDATGDDQARGKQTLKPGGILYTPTTGIWQTVWLEPVATTSVESLHLVPNVDRSTLTVLPSIRGVAHGVTVEVAAHVEKTEVARQVGLVGESVSLKLADARLWTPDDPFLYGLTVTLKRDGKVIDRVESYFGMRKVEVGRDAQGTTRILLNGRFVLQVGLLDQGFWPDGLYTAPTDAALKSDVAAMKKLGFNLLRKHVKVEPARWYYWCDKLGMLVWQDMPSVWKTIGPNDPDLTLPEEQTEQFEQELKSMIDALRNHPSIVMWVVFNEGWGQYDTERLTTWVKGYDPSRLVNNASGWADRGVGDVHDWHVYPGPASPKPEPARAAVLGEYGGLGLGIEGHTWQKEAWGYQGMADRRALTDRFVELQRKVYKLVEGSGLSACVYTQVSDVESECNGLLTYDRKITKVDAKLVANANRGEFPPEPLVSELLSTSEKVPQMWRYTTQAPQEGWVAQDFDDQAWNEAPGGFGTAMTPGAVVGTVWDSGGIWLRRTFDLPARGPGELHLRIHHDEDAEVYLNGVPAARLAGFTTEYVLVPLPTEAAKALKPKGNVLAVRCRQTTGGQFIDVGIVAVQGAKKRR